MISIILPVYKAEKHIRKCLESVLNQSYSNLEILLVYMNGNDRLLDIVDSLNDSRIKVIFQHDDGGPGGARNMGLDIASGEYTGFIEADDYIENDFYEKLHWRIVSDHSDIAWGEIRMDDRKTMLTEHLENTTETDFLRKYQMVMNGASFDKLFRTDFLKKYVIRFTEKIRFEDNPFLLKAFYHSGKISLVKNAVYHYNPEPWSVEYRARIRNHVVPIAAEMMDFADKNGFSRQQKALLQRKIIQCVAGSFIFEPDIYRRISDVMGNPLFLKLRYLKHRIKNLKRM